MRNIHPIHVLFILSLLICGCTSIRPAAVALSTQQHAECLVCKKNADLACVDVVVDKDTPRYVYNGRTYYFCSDECRGKFAKNPAKYVPK